ncbi:MAG: cytochrome b5-like heme/steroid binding domain-containing protein [Candidatus Micrarchaeota archaeon]
MEKIILVSVLLLLLIGCTSQSAGSQGAVGTQSAPAPATQNAAPGQGSQATVSGPKAYSLPEVSKHSTASDCWVAVHDKVYDITSYISSGQHPEPLDIYCGKDATTAFDTRQGKGPHPPKASNMMNNFYVGDLAK